MENHEEWREFKRIESLLGGKNLLIRSWEVSNLGRIRYYNMNKTPIKYIYVQPSLTGGHLKTRKARPFQYYALSLNYPTKYVHRIVAQAFIPNPDNLPTVDHINGDTTDNRVENLQWLSHKDNINKRTQNNFTQ